MRRIWRSLKLGMKSLLLHKLRSGLTVLGIVFGVAAVISMLAVGEGSSRKAQRQFAELGATNIIYRSIKPSEESMSSGGGRRMVLNYGLKYDDFDRLLATVPTIKKALPIREIRKQIRYLSRYLDGRVVGTTQDYADFNRWTSIRDGFSPPRTTPGTRTSPCWLPRRPRRCSLMRTRSASRSSWARIITRSSA